MRVSSGRTWVTALRWGFLALSLFSKLWPEPEPMTSRQNSFRYIKSQPHFVRGLKPQRLIQRPPLVPGVQIDGPQAPFLDPCQDCLHDLPRDSAIPKLRLRVHIQDHRPLSTWVDGTDGPWGQQHTAAARDTPR